MAFDLIVATSGHPLRWVSRIGVFISFLNLTYVGYILGVYFFKSHVAEGWVTHSMQTAVMFFALFAVLTVLCEYVGKLHFEFQKRPLYSTLEERCSSVLVDVEKRKNVVSKSFHREQTL